MPSTKQFREFKVRKGKRVATPNEFIQLTRVNLQSIGEKKQLSEARRLKKMMNFNL